MDFEDSKIGVFPYLCQNLSQSGFAVLSFNHALCGVRENPYEITDLLGFSNNSMTQELKDWDLILDSVRINIFVVFIPLRMPPIPLKTQHPFTGPSPPLIEAVSHTISCLKENYADSYPTWISRLQAIKANYSSKTRKRSDALTTPTILPPF